MFNVDHAASLDNNSIRNKIVLLVMAKKKKHMRNSCVFYIQENFFETNNTKKILIKFCLILK